jgi:hypothetical protein
MKMKHLAATLGLVGLMATANAGLAQAAGGPTAPAPAYVDENDKDPAPLKIDSVHGQIQGLGGDAMARAALALFTEEGHALVSTAMSDKDGKFNFGKVDKGFYRLVVRVQGLCTANVPIKVESSPLAHKKLVITMQPKDIDTCSYGMTKR